MIMNLGSMNLIVALSVLSIGFFALLLLCPARCVKCRAFGQNQVKKSFCNRILGFLDGSLFIILISAFINISEPDVKHNSSYYISCVAIGICFVYLLGLPLLLLSIRNRLNEGQWKERFGYIYEELNHKSRGLWVLTFPIAFAARIWVISVAIIYLQEYLIY